MKKYYIAYGSNLNVEQMRYRCPDARIVGTSVIPDYQLLFKGSKTGSYLTMGVQNGEITSPAQAPQPPTRRLVRGSPDNNVLPKTAAL